MADNYLYRVCPECGGDGVISQTNFEGSEPVVREKTCENCQGGWLFWGILRDEMIGEE